MREWVPSLYMRTSKSRKLYKKVIEEINSERMPFHGGHCEVDQLVDLIEGKLTSSIDDDA